MRGEAESPGGAAAGHAGGERADAGVGAGQGRAGPLPPAPPGPHLLFQADTRSSACCCSRPSPPYSPTITWSHSALPRQATTLRPAMARRAPQPMGARPSPMELPSPAHWAPADGVIKGLERGSLELGGPGSVELSGPGRAAVRGNRGAASSLFPRGSCPSPFIPWSPSVACPSLPKSDPVAAMVPKSSEIQGFLRAKPNSFLNARHFRPLQWCTEGSSHPAVASVASCPCWSRGAWETTCDGCAHPAWRFQPYSFAPVARSVPRCWVRRETGAEAACSMQAAKVAA